MFAPQTPSASTAAAGAKWSKAVLVITAALLLFLDFENMFFVVPTYRVVMAGVGATFSAPARLAISITHFGAVFFVACAVLLGFALVRERRGKTGAFSLALGSVALLATVYLGLVCTVYLDFARIAGRLH